MKLKNPKLASMLTSALLLATSLVTLAAAPARADAYAAPLLLNFDSESVGVQNGMRFAEFDPGWFEILADSNQPWAPANGSVGSVNMVKAKMGSGGYSGVFVAQAVSATSSLVSSTTAVITMNFWAPEAGKTVKMTLESAQGVNVTSVNASSTTIVGWQTLSFNFANATPTPNYSAILNRAFIDYDPGATALSQDFFFDDVSFNGATAAPLTAPPLLVNFDSNSPGVQNSMRFAEFDPGWFEILADSNQPWAPANGSVGSVNMAKAKMGSGNYSGVFLALDVNQRLVSSTTKIVKMNFWAPEAGKAVKLSLESAQGVDGTSVNASATTVVGWQVLTFDFTNASPTPNYSAILDRAFIDYDPGATAVSQDFFFDDVSFNGAAAAALTNAQAQNQQSTASATVSLVTTLSQAVQYAFETKPTGWLAIEGASGDLVATPAGVNAPSGANSGYVTESPSAANPWEGVIIDTRTSTEVISAQSKIVQLRVKAPTSTTSVNLKLEAADGSGGIERAVTAGTTSWQVLTFDFSGSGYNESTNYVRIVLFFNVTLRDPGDQTFYFDDLAFTPNPVTETVTPRTGENKGNYPHIRLDKYFLDTFMDATWWDGVWQYRDEDTRAYLKYIPVRSTFKLTYTVTDADDKPLANAPVTLIVNANYSCAKTFFMYENTMIGPDDCAGKGETQLPAKLTDADGKVTFVLTNTNATGEKMPTNLNGAPNGTELGTNIKPHLIGATREGIDMLFAHFVEVSDTAKIIASATDTAKTGEPYVAKFQFLDEDGKPMANQLAEVYINGVQSKQDWILTDAQGRVGIPVPNAQNLEGTSAVAVSVKRPGWLPMTATTMVTWEQGTTKVSMAPASNSVEVKVVNAANESVKITINGKAYERTPTTGLVTYKFPATVGKKIIRVTIGKKTFVRGVTVRR